MIEERIDIYAFGVQVSKRPAVVTVKTGSTVEGYVRFPWAVTGLQADLTACTGPFTGINRYDSMYGVTGAHAVTGLQSRDVQYRVDCSGVTGIQQDQTYAMKISGRSTAGQKADADIILSISNEVE